MSKKALCVDDSPTIRMLLKKNLEPMGFDVTEAENGQKGIDAVSGSDFDIIFMDVNMPVLDGFEAVKGIKAISGKDSIPIVFLTTESSDDKKKAGKDLGVSGWMVKPFEPESLEKIIKVLVK